MTASALGRRRLAYMLRPVSIVGHPAAQVLSVYRDFGVIPKKSRDDNYNRTPVNLSSYQLVEPGNLVVNRMKAWQGSLGISEHRGIVSPDYEVLRIVAPEVDGRFLHALLRSPSLVREYGLRSSGIRPSQWRLYWEQLREIEISLPNLDQQNVISEYLDRETSRIDLLISGQGRLIETLHERRRSMIEVELAREAATSGARLRHVVRWVNQGWSPQCLPWPADGVHTWAVLKTGATNRGTFSASENKELPPETTPLTAAVVQDGDLVVSRASTRDLVGSAAVVRGDYPKLMLSDKQYALKLDESRAWPEYVALLLGTRTWRDLIQLEATGASPSMQNISQADILNLPMPLPTVETQKRVLVRIDALTSQLDALITKAEQFIALAMERRSALITAAVTGQIDVRTMA